MANGFFGNPGHFLYICVYPIDAQSSLKKTVLFSLIKASKIQKAQHKHLIIRYLIQKLRYTKDYSKVYEKCCKGMR